MTLNTAKSRGWTAAVAAAILATVAALAIVGVARAGSASDLVLGSATVAPGESVTVELTATVENMGSFSFDFEFDATELEVTACTSGFGVCTMGLVSQIHMNGATSDPQNGTTGDVVLGTITFKALGADGTTVDVTSDATTQFISDEVGDLLTISTPAGVITIAAPVATASPTATPAAVPQTGGAPGTSSANSMAWLLAAAGLVVVAGGAWAVTRVSREN